MATKLTTPVVREDTRDHYIITVAPEGLYLREKGRRTTYGPLTYGRLYLQAVRAEIERRKVEKKRQRRARK